MVSAKILISFGVPKIQDEIEKSVLIKFLWILLLDNLFFKTNLSEFSFCLIASKIQFIFTRLNVSLEKDELTRLLT